MDRPTSGDRITAWLDDPKNKEAARRAGERTGEAVGAALGFILGVGAFVVPLGILAFLIYWLAF